MSAPNPLKNYDFDLEVDGIVVAYLQGVTVPTVEFAEHKHGTPGNSPDAKTPGKKIVGELSCEMVVEAVGGDPDIWANFQNTAGSLRPSYIGDGFLVENDPQGVESARYFIKSLWIKKIESSGHDSRGDNSADVMRTVVFSVEDYVRQGV